jgi:hypothetical protein
MQRRAEEQLEALDLPGWIRARREAADEDLVEDVAPAGAPVEAAPVELQPAPELDELEPAVKAVPPPSRRRRRRRAVRLRKSFVDLLVDEIRRRLTFLQPGGRQ